MNDEELLPQEPDLEPIQFEIVNGHLVKVFVSHFWEKLSESDLRLGYTPAKYYAIRIYCTEDTLPRRITQQYEMLPNHEFDESAIPGIWAALEDHIFSREYRNHDSLEDFLAWFTEIAAKLSNAPQDLADHYQRLPALTFPENFDRVDDSHFNDQNDS